MREYMTLIEQSLSVKEIKSRPVDHGVQYYTDGGEITLWTDNPYSPRKESVVSFVVDEDKRGKGIGRQLLTHAISQHNDIGAQVDGQASLKLFYDAGFRNPGHPDGSLAEYEAIRRENSSIFMAMNDREGNSYATHPIEEDVLDEGTDVSGVDVVARRAAAKAMLDHAEKIWEDCIQKWQRENPGLEDHDGEIRHTLYDNLYQHIQKHEQRFTIDAMNALSLALKAVTVADVEKRYGPVIEVKKKKGPINVTAKHIGVYIEIKEYSSDSYKETSNGYFMGDDTLPYLCVFAKKDDVFQSLTQYLQLSAFGEMFEREELLPKIMKTFIHEFAHLDQWLRGSSMTANDHGYINVGGGKRGGRRTPEKGTVDHLRYHGSHMEIDSFASDAASEIINGLARYHRSFGDDEINHYDVGSILTDIANGYGADAKSVQRYDQLKRSTFNGEFDDVGLDRSEVEVAYQRFLKLVYKKLWNYSKEKDGKSLGVKAEPQWREWAKEGLVKCSAKLAEEVATEMATNSESWKDEDYLFSYMPEEFSRANRFIERYFFGDDMDWEKSMKLTEKFKSVVRSYFRRYKATHRDAEAA